MVLLLLTLKLILNLIVDCRTYILLSNYLRTFSHYFGLVYHRI